MGVFMFKNVLFTRVGHHYIPTSNIDDSIEWYKNKLGLKFITKFEDRGSRIDDGCVPLPT